MILIASLTNDLHALSVQRRVREDHAQPCAIVEVDQLAYADVLSFDWRAGGERRLIDRDGVKVAVEDVRAIWWRRPRGQQHRVAGEGFADLVNNECAHGLIGCLLAHARAKWISDHDATIRASNKLYQLAVAQQQGFRVPDTLVSQSKTQISNFVARHNGRVITKVIAGSDDRFYLTRSVPDISHMDDDAFTACPVLLQEKIEGDTHIRLNLFGARGYAARISTEHLDWRPDLTDPISAVTLDQDVIARCSKTLAALGLAMGVIDLKITPSGETVWLEVNPQGQFLFLEPLTGMDLAGAFAEYLATSAQA